VKGVGQRIDEDGRHHTDDGDDLAQKITFHD
jgi:hypothetical protein